MPLGPAQPLADYQLDDCTGSDANPINGRTSPQGYTWAGGLQGQDDCKLVSNFILDDADGGTNGHCYISNAQWGENQELQVTLQGVPTGSGYMFLMARVQNPPTTGLNAYYFGYLALSGSPIWVLGRILNNDSPTEIASSVAAGTVVVGDKLRIRCYGGTISGWVFRSGAWTSVISAASALVLGSGTFDIEFDGNDTVAKVNDVRGGHTVSYKSQGSGVATETSGAALSPLCPAVVDAGDVLIAHTYWEDTTTAPSTPSGWTLLDGPRVIETTIGRHWIFGKVADGTEDGASVALGSPAVTTQRGARVYSFAGRVSGAITELVQGFSATSHATNPQMPTVSTTHLASLAVACVAQNDNNTAASASGEAGGDWTESVAEFTSALTPGLMLQVQTAVLDTNPGTISGGSVATTSDPCGVIAFEIRAVPASASVPPRPAVLSQAMHRAFSY